MPRARAWLAAFLVAGCSFIPKYERPATPVAKAFPGDGSGGDVAADLGWRELFDDPRLQALIALALRENRDLRVAALNVELTRAQHHIVRSELYPTVTGQGGVAVTGGTDDASARYSLSVGVTSYEL